jgi:hypothetical protein
LGDVDRKEFKKWMKVEIKRFFEWNRVWICVTRIWRAWLRLRRRTWI